MRKGSAVVLLIKNSTMIDPKGGKAAPDDVSITVRNIIGVTMEDLPEKNRSEHERKLQQEIEAEVEERCKKKLACFQKTRGGVVKKGGTTRASQPVSSPFTLDEHVHMIDVSVMKVHLGSRVGFGGLMTNN
jgi:hypothetical protein